MKKKKKLEMNTLKVENIIFYYIFRTTNLIFQKINKKF